MAQRVRRRQRRRRGGFGSKLLLALMVLGSLVAIAMLSAGIWVLSIAAETPDINELSPIDGGATSRIHAADGSRLGFIQSDEARTPIPLARMPEDLQNATIAIEDARFYEHDGVDLSSIARAAVENLKAGQTVQGGSTLTMQLVRNLYIVDPSRDLERKIREADLAEELENERSKEWILEQYLNTSSYGTVDGRTAIGVQAAADTYFAKPARELNLAESALIAGLTQAPSQYNPLQSPSAALARRNDVLEAMAAQGYISEERAREAAAAGIHLERGDRYTSIREPFFFDYVEQLLIESYGVNTVRRGGLDVYTTIDPKLQQAGRAAIEGQLDLPDDPSAAMVTIDPSNGHVLAMASSASYETEQYNLASQGRRQPGSAFKTFVLTAAVRRGIDPDTTTYASRELDLETPYGPWEVSTYSNSYSGAITLTQATLASDNTVYAQLDLDVGPEAVRDTAYDMGITTELDALPAEGIGGLRLGVSPLEMANAYATLASGGIRNTPVAIERVEFPDGEVDTPQEDKRERAFSDGVAFEVTRILEQNVRGGTGTAANIGCPAAGKTGTTDEFNDAWFAGFTPELSTAVWVGYPDALRSMASVHGITVAGGTFPARIWGEYMNVAKRSSCKGFPEAPQNPVAFEPFFGSYAQEGLELLRQEQEEEEEHLKEEAKAEKKAEKKAEEKAEEKAEKGSAGAGADPGYDADAYAPGIQPPSRRQLERAHSGG